MKVFDLHCDTLSELRYAERRGEAKSFAANDLHIDLEKLHKGDYMLQCFAAFVNLSDPTPGADPLVTALEEVDVFKRIMAKYSDQIAPVYRPEDIRRNAQAGKISGMLTIEEGGCCKGSLGVLRRMYELGVRMMTLTWNYPNQLGYPAKATGGEFAGKVFSEAGYGLTARGIEFLEEMENLGMIIDVAHLNDKIHPPFSLHNEMDFLQASDPPDPEKGQNSESDNPPFSSVQDPHLNYFYEVKSLFPVPFLSESLKLYHNAYLLLSFSIPPSFFFLIISTVCDPAPTSSGRSHVVR